MNRNFAVARLVALCATVVALIALPVHSQAQDSGTIRMEILSRGFIIGTSGGSGVLTYKGKSYQLGIGGLSAEH
jgi:hypothetical protein